MDEADPPRALLRVGHGAADRGRLGDLLAGAGVGLVVDVRRYPGSRTNPDVGSDSLAAWLPDRGIDYRWDERLGGRRRLDPAVSDPAVADPDSWWTVAAFRAYAAYTRTPEFVAALAALLGDVGARRTTVMCSESVWWRCHRRLIADVALLGHGVPVRHLMPHGRVVAHRPAEGARVRDDGLVVWDGR